MKRILPFILLFLSVSIYGQNEAAIAAKADHSYANACSTVCSNYGCTKTREAADHNAQDDGNCETAVIHERSDIRHLVQPPAEQSEDQGEYPIPLFHIEEFFEFEQFF